MDSSNLTYIIMRYYGGLILFCYLSLTSCNKPSPGFDAGGPITRYLMGKWILEKVVSPSGTKTGDQIGYTEILLCRGEENVGDADKVFRNDTLVVNKIWSRDPWPVADAKKMTVIVTYTDGMKRFYKIYQELGKNPVLEASGYLPEIGTAQDSVKYYYTFQ